MAVKPMRWPDYNQLKIQFMFFTAEAQRMRREDIKGFLCALCVSAVSFL